MVRITLIHLGKKKFLVFFLNFKGPFCLLLPRKTLKNGSNSPKSRNGPFSPELIFQDTCLGQFPGKLFFRIFKNRSGCRPKAYSKLPFTLKAVKNSQYVPKTAKRGIPSRGQFSRHMCKNLNITPLDPR